jgi:hypothetical protein
MAATGSAAGAAHCSACGAPMACNRDDPGGCWCARVAALPADLLEPGKGCLCEACLRARAEALVPDTKQTAR